MKTLLKLLVVIIGAWIFWGMSKFWDFEREYYLSNKAIEFSMPFDVKIDVEFLRSLKPADE